MHVHFPLSLTLWFVLLLVSAAVGLCLGSVTLPITELLHPTTQTQLLLQLRIPHVINACCCGALLALAGTLLQAVLRNPLADPYILGISGGAATAGLAAILLGISTHFLIFATLLGSLCSIALLFILTAHAKKNTSQRLLLSGVMLSALWSAAINFLLNFSDNALLRNTWFWMMGDLSQATYTPMLIILSLISAVIAFYYGSTLNLLALGEIKAQSLGINLRYVQWQIYVVSALLCTVCVIIAGPIGFIGLLSPHLARMTSRNNSRYLLPRAALIGSNLLILADGLSRSLFAPLQLPVGIMTTLIGVPLFLILLQRSAES